ncbi:MAG: phosphatase PAP2-related protein [Candidatus Binatia bacterium]
MMLPLWAVRLALVARGLGGWFWTQALIAKRAFPDGRIGDLLHDLTAPLHARLLAHPPAANRLLIVTSGLVDLLGLFLILRAVMGPSLRQLCQALCSLPCPEGMIWRHPGFPSLLVTYGTASDLFFSGHTAVSVYGCLELGAWGVPAFAALGAPLAVTEVTTVIVLRAHYTMDVFAGAVTALWVFTVASTLAPSRDGWLAAVAR